MKNERIIIIGLGNSGPEYARTYHNAGFLFIEWVLNKFGAQEGSRGVTRIELPNGILELIRPQGFMNVSGPTLHKLLKTHEVESAIVAHDESDLQLGSFKFSRDSGAAGHKGVLSVMETFKIKSFARLRIGIRPDAPVRQKAEEFVLKKIMPEHMSALEHVFEEGWKTLEKEVPGLRSDQN